MTRRPFALSGLLLALAWTPASAQPSLLSRAAALADFDSLRNALREAHGGLYRFESRSAVDQRFAKHRAAITGDISARDFTTRVATLIAELRDGHERIEYPDAMMNAFNASLVFPLRVQLEDTRLVIAFNDSPTDSTLRPGMEITRINGESAIAVVNKILPTIPADGFIETGRRYRMGRTFGQLYWLYVDTASVFTIDARDAAGKAVQVTLPGVHASEREKSGNTVNTLMRAAMARWDLPNGNITLSYPGDSTVARLRIRGFDGPRFLLELDSVFTLLQQRKTPALVLDLRGNGGGVDLYGAGLVSHFVSAPFRYFDRIHIPTRRPTFATWKPSTFEELEKFTVPDPVGGFLATKALHAGVELQAPSSVGFTGPVTVLIDGGSYSTTADVAATLRHLKRAKFIGEETAGGAEGNTSGLNAMVTLPNSGLRLKIMMFDYYNAVTVREHGRGTIPEIIAPTRLADLLRGDDPALAQALRASADSAHASSPRPSRQPGH